MGAVFMGAVFMGAVFMGAVFMGAVADKTEHRAQELFGALGDSNVDGLGAAHEGVVVSSSASRRSNDARRSSSVCTMKSCRATNAKTN